MTTSVLEIKMNNFIHSIQLSIEQKNWYGALTLALTMPDICGKLEFPKQHTNKRYINWFEKYLGNIYKTTIHGEVHVFLSGRDAYALRCSYLHGGEADITKQKQQEILDGFVFLASNDPLKKPSHCNRINEILQLDTQVFCEDIVEGVKKWIEDNKHKESIQSAASSMLEIHLNGVTLYGGSVRIE